MHYCGMTITKKSTTFHKCKKTYSYYLMKNKPYQNVLKDSNLEKFQRILM